MKGAQRLDGPHSDHHDGYQEKDDHHQHAWMEEEEQSSSLETSRVSSELRAHGGPQRSHSGKVWRGTHTALC
ncbi:unnamed protein product [Arctogadus glacialis]